MDVDHSMKHYLFVYLLILIAPVIVSTAVADSPAVLQGFSAEMVQSRLDGQSVHAKVYRAQGHTRTEYQQAGSRVIEIINPQERMGWLIWPDVGIYAEQPLLPLAIKVARNELSENPCDQLSDYQCKQQGEELINGRMASIWDVRGTNAQWREWIDRERNFPVRQLFKDGGRTERVLEKLVEIEGRTVELWRATSGQKDAIRSEMLFWFDPLLATNLREDVPGEMVRELRNVQLRQFEPQLFQLPLGLERMPDPVK